MAGAEPGSEPDLDLEASSEGFRGVQPENALLLQAFEKFSQASLQLERAYSDLQDHTEQLDLELQAANQRLKQSLLEQESVSLHLRGVLDAMKSGVLVIDLDGTVVDINPSAIQILGVKTDLAHFRDMSFPQPVEAFISACIDNTVPRVSRKEVAIVRDGEQIDVELSFSLIRPERGGILSVLLMLNDVTLINRLQSQAKRNVRLAAMGEMAAELAHEIRNPLGSVKLFASLLEKDLAPQPDQQGLAVQISSGIQTLENIVSNILAFSANVTPKRESVSLRRVIDESLPLFEHEMKHKSIRLEVDAPASSPSMSGDLHLLKQVVLNLCNNAIKAMQPGGLLSVRVHSREEFVEITISDNGCGIPEKALHKIFDPFYTTFPGGTGLGLSVVNQIVEKHGGAIDIKSEISKGTSVLLSFPRLVE